MSDVNVTVRRASELPLAEDLTNKEVIVISGNALERAGAEQIAAGLRETLEVLLKAYADVEIASAVSAAVAGEVTNRRQAVQQVWDSLGEVNDALQRVNRRLTAVEGSQGAAEVLSEADVRSLVEEHYHPEEAETLTADDIKELISEHYNPEAVDALSGDEIAQLVEEKFL